MSPAVELAIEVEAPADLVYALVADLPRMSEWSPETTRVRWLGGATAAVPGARVRGWNRRGPVRWFTDGRVVVAEPGRELTWDVAFGPLPVARWSYRFESLGPARCRVTEAFEDRRGTAVRAFGRSAGMADRAGINQANMHRTLERLKAAAEAAVA